VVYIALNDDVTQLVNLAFILEGWRRTRRDDVKAVE
jgi:hypothetical protein